MWRYSINQGWSIYAFWAVCRSRSGNLSWDGHEGTRKGNSKLPDCPGFRNTSISASSSSATYKFITFYTYRAPSHTLRSAVSCLLSCQIAEVCCTCPVIRGYGGWDQWGRAGIVLWPSYYWRISLFWGGYEMMLCLEQSGSMATKRYVVFLSFFFFLKEYYAQFIVACKLKDTLVLFHNHILKAATYIHLNKIYHN